MDKKVREYISKQNQPQKEILQRLRKLILKTLPKAEEEMRWGVPVYAGGKFYTAAMKKQVNMGFAVNGLSKEEASQFEGSGKTMKHLKISSLKDVDGKKLAKLLRLVNTKAVCKGC